MKKLITILFSSFILCSLSLAQEFSFKTTTNYGAAIQAAKDNDKIVMVLLAMTGCGHCKALKQKVLTSNTFAEFARTELDVVAYDYAKRRDMSAEDQAGMKSLIDSHNITGFPTIILLDSSENVLLKSSGYGGSGPDEVVKLFKERISAKQTAL